MSTSILMKKVQKWGVENNIDLEVKAVGNQSYEEVYKNFDCILLGPQISYKLEGIRSNVTIPVEVIPGADYALGNAENIYTLAQSLLENKLS